MRKIGLIGGTSWMATVEYYSQLNEITNQKFNSNVNPPLYIANVNQKEIHDHQKTGDWPAIASIFAEKCSELTLIGCDAIAFCANTPHRVFDEVQATSKTKILHMGDSIGRVMQGKGAKKIGLLGTQYTMEGDFIVGRIRDHFSTEVLIPKEIARREIQSLLYNEMSHGTFSEDAQKFFLAEIGDLKRRGAEIVVLSCTEFPMLLSGIETALPTVSSTSCHIEDIANFMLS